MPQKHRQSKKPASSEQAAEGGGLELKTSSEDFDSFLEASPLTSAQWTTLRKRILDDLQRHGLADVFADSATRGAVYRWGMATANGNRCSDQQHWLTRIAVGASTRGKRFAGIQPSEMVERFHESLGRRESELVGAAEAVVWAAAMPGLLRHLDETEWWRLLGAIQDFRDGLLNRDGTEPMALVGVAELGITLSFGLRALPSCRRLVGSSRQALKQWCDQGDQAVSATLARPRDARLVMASLLRTRMLLAASQSISKSSGKPRKDAGKKVKSARRKKLFAAIDESGIELATWIAAMTRPGGVHALGGLTKQDSRDDAAPKGLLRRAAALEPESLGPAMKAALGESRSKGRLAWQVSLPESMLHDEDAKLACLLPEWDVLRGRMVIQYGRPSKGLERQRTCLEMMAGQAVLISGECETHLRVEGDPIRPVGDWVATCEYSDDDVHYLELEQPHEAGYVLQRQLMLIREDRCCYFADAVIEGRFQMGTEVPRDHAAEAGSPQSAGDLPMIEYQVRFPLGDSIHAEPEADTNELFLCDRKRRALVMPLSAAEWRNASTGLPTTTLQATEDQHLLLTARGRGQLYAPLWFDLSRRRFSKKRTWRRLTVGQQLAILPTHLAVAFRVQVGAMQWILYRSMAPPEPRTFLGKHMIADFYCARFDAAEESYEDLITVEDNPS